MRTVRAKVFKFNELTEDAKQKAIRGYRGDGIDTSYIYDDAYETVKKFNEIFGTREGSRSWLEVQTGHIDDSILQLSGLRLRTYIINNFYGHLYSGKYYSAWSSAKRVHHRKVRSKEKGSTWPADQRGEFWNVYTGLPLVPYNHSCELTGVCYDESLLQPLYEFIEWKLRPDYNSTLDFETLINDCFASLEKDVEAEAEHRNSDAAIIEEIEGNDYEFYANGERYYSHK